MKNIIYFTFSILVIMCIVACGDNKKPEPVPTSEIVSPTSNPEETVTPDNQISDIIQSNTDQDAVWGLEASIAPAYKMIDWTSYDVKDNEIYIFGIPGSELNLKTFTGVDTEVGLVITDNDKILSLYQDEIRDEIK